MVFLWLSIPILKYSFSYFLLFQSHAQLVNLDFGDKVKDYGDAPNGIYIIVSGMLRVECREPSKLHEVSAHCTRSPNFHVMEN